jgi:hypothetical protein
VSAITHKCGGKGVISPQEAIPHDHFDYRLSRLAQNAEMTTSLTF